MDQWIEGSCVCCVQLEVENRMKSLSETNSRNKIQVRLYLWVHS